MGFGFCRGWFQEKVNAGHSIRFLSRSVHGWVGWFKDKLDAGPDFGFRLRVACRDGWGGFRQVECWAQYPFLMEECLGMGGVVYGKPDAGHDFRFRWRDGWGKLNAGHKYPF